MSGTLDLTGIMKVERIRVRLDIKVRKDSGSDTSSASGATTITFNKSFIDIRSIIVTAQPSVYGTPEQLTAIYDFEDVPNPTDFDVYVYDNGGNLVARNFSWQAEGF